MLGSQTVPFLKDQGGEQNKIPRQLQG